MPFRAVLLAILSAGTRADQAVVSGEVGGFIASSAPLQLCHSASKGVAGTGDLDAQCVGGTNDEGLDNNEDNSLLQERMFHVQLLQNRLHKTTKKLTLGACPEACAPVKEEQATCIDQCECETGGSGDCDAMALQKEIEFMNKATPCSIAVEVAGAAVPTVMRADYAKTGQVPYLNRPLYKSLAGNYIFWGTGGWQIGADYTTEEDNAATIGQGDCPYIGAGEEYEVQAVGNQYVATLYGEWIGGEVTVHSVQYNDEDLYIFAIAQLGHVKMVSVDSNGTRLGNRFWTLPQTEFGASLITDDDHITPKHLIAAWDSPTGSDVTNEQYNIKDIHRQGRMDVDLEKGLSIKVISAKGLKDCDVGRSNSDPFMTVSIKGPWGSEELCRSDVIMNSQAPQFYVTCWTDKVVSSVEVDIWDKDFTKASELMGAYTWTSDQGGFIAERRKLALPGEDNIGDVLLTIIPAAERKQLLAAAS